MFEPIPSNKMFNSLINTKAIVMAANIRILNGVARGVFRAAKEMDAPFIIELAASECNLEGGYTGLTPQELGKRSKAIAKEVGWGIWALHADHTPVKKGTPEEIAGVKKLLDAHVEAGYTSFAIDASFLFDASAPNVEKALEKNINATSELVHYIKQKMHGKEFGLEVEVGEIGYHDDSGKVKTSPEEAVAFIRGLKAKGVEPNVLAIANGSAHGNVYDVKGNLLPQLSIDIEQTKKVAKALKDAGFKVKIAQHGITGTPRELIKEKFPHEAILKGNVGTFWQNIVFDILEEKEPKLYADIKKWTIEKYSAEAAKKGITNEGQIFGLNGKNATKHFFDRLYSLPKSTVEAIEEKAFEEAKLFFDAFHAKGSAEIVRKAL